MWLSRLRDNWALVVPVKGCWHSSQIQIKSLEDEVVEGETEPRKVRLAEDKVAAFSGGGFEEWEPDPKD